MLGEVAMQLGPDSADLGAGLNGDALRLGGPGEGLARSEDSIKESAAADLKFHIDSWYYTGRMGASPWVDAGLCGRIA
jgi:hypothetical protein